MKQNKTFQDSKRALYQFAVEIDKPSHVQKRESKKKYKQMLQLLQKVAGDATKRMVLNKR